MTTTSIEFMCAEYGCIAITRSECLVQTGLEHYIGSNITFEGNKNVRLMFSNESNKDEHPHKICITFFLIKM